MTKAWKIVWALATALVAGQSASAQQDMARVPVPPATGQVRGSSLPQMPSDDPIPFAPSPYLFREFDPKLPSTFPEIVPPSNTAAPALSDPPTGPRRVMPFLDIEVGYALVMYRKQALSFPTLTFGPPTDPIPGALGNPNTFWLFNRPGGNEAPINGGRARVATWLPDLESISLEAIALVPEPQNLSVITNSGNYSAFAISRPFFNPIAGVNDAFPVSVPNLFSSVSADSFRTYFYGGEANLRYEFRSNYKAILGVRYFRIDESYTNQDNITNLVDGSFSSFHDNFSTSNKFIGPQIGLLYHTGSSPWIEFDFFAKIAVGTNRQSVEVSGQSLFTDPTTGVQFVDATKGTYAQPSNIGIYRRSNVAAMPELGANVHFQVGPKCKIGINYSGLLLTNMVRPSGQIDYLVNPQNLLGNNIPPNLPSPPSFNHTTFWMQTVSFGVEYLF